MYSRGDRVRELLLHELSGLLREVKDPGIQGLLTITGLKLAKDRKTAVVYFSVLGPAESRASTAKALERSAGWLRSRLFERLQTRIVPSLQFEYDPTPERAQRIEGLLSRIEDERRGQP